MDADSELITGVNVLPATATKAGDAVHLIEQEEAAQGNDVQGRVDRRRRLSRSGLAGVDRFRMGESEVFTPPTDACR